MTTSNNPPSATWRTTALAWLALGLFDATQTVVSMHAMGMQHAWGTLFAVTLLTWAVWAAATPMVRRLLRRYPFSWRSGAACAVHAGACLAIGAAWAAWGALLEHLTNPFADPAGPLAFVPLLRAEFIGNLVGNVILYGAIVALCTILEARARLLQQQAVSARLSELLAQSQLAALRLQLEPHFIFNALNAVTALVRQQRGAEAITVVAELGDLLRRVTDGTTRQFVTLEEEADFVRKYLDIQRLRFGERLRYRIDIPAALMHERVPDFIVQPLVENAIKHGIAKRARGGEVCVTVTPSGAGLALNVRNDGPLLPAQLREGVGLANTRQRLQALYGTAHALTLENHAAGVMATITLPLREHAGSEAPCAS